MREDLTGRTFGRLTVLRQAGPEEAKRGRRYWVCLCSCGKQVVVEGTHLRTGHTKKLRHAIRGDSARAGEWWNFRTEIRKAYGSGTCETCKRSGSLLEMPV
ncbi:MAG: hypothetical protein V8S93_13070 [Lachnospiraceae bacterium]